MPYQSTKTYGHDLGLTCTFRQWRAESHCKYLHGYALGVKLVFEADTLDHRGWVVDFGSLKSLKGGLEIQFDHTTLVAVDDPLMPAFERLSADGLIQLRVVPATGCEAFARLIYEYACVWLMDNGYSPRVRLISVEVREHGANSAVYSALSHK